MARSYDLGKKSDVRRFARDLERMAGKAAKRKIQRKGLEIECPKCGAPMSVTPGLNTCPSCRKTTEVAFDWTNL